MDRDENKEARVVLVMAFHPPALPFDVPVPSGGGKYNRSRRF
jgi:hypothetical protein